MPRASLVVCAVLITACGGGSHTPDPIGGGSTTPLCGAYAGAWTAVHVDQCGKITTTAVMLMQNQCVVSGSVPGIGDFTMNVRSGNRTATVRKDEACDRIELPGTVDEVTADGLHVVYGSGPDGCCRHGGLTIRK
jgi:hypothetical protein